MSTRPSTTTGAAATSLHWSPAAMCSRGVQTYRASLAYLTRLWTPPAALAGVESADYVFCLVGILCVMEGYHAVGYTLRQLRRFGAEATQRTRAAAGGTAPHGTDAPPEHKDVCEPPAESQAATGAGVSQRRAPPNALHDGGVDVRLVRVSAAAAASRDNVQDHTFDSGPSSPLAGAPPDAALASRLAWYRHAFWRSVTGMPRNDSSFGSQSGGSDAGAPRHAAREHHDSSSASNTRAHGAGGDVEDALGLARGDSGLSPLFPIEDDLAAAPQPLALHGDAAHLPSAARRTAGAASASGVDDGDGDEDDEEQAWEATPEMLMHYWRQLERSILSAPRRSPARVWRTLPAAMVAYEPDTAAVQAWCDVVVEAALHHGTPPVSWSAWLASRVRSSPAAPPAVDAGGVRAAEPGVHTRAPRCPFAVPAAGCFCYHERPDMDDFALDEDDVEDVDDDDEEDVDEEEVEEVEEEVDGEEEARNSPDHTRAPSPPTFDLVDSDASEAEAEAEGGGGGGSGTAAAPRGVTVRLPTPPRRRYELKWEALFLVWFNIAEVSISSREIRALLLKCAPPAFLVPAMTHDTGPTALDVASTNLSLLWLWSTVQRVFETLVINEDVEKCDGDVEELAAYAAPLFTKCIARWPTPAAMATTSEAALNSGLVGLICGAQAAWVSLTVVLRRLLSLRRQLYVRNTWSLARYMYSSSKAKLISAALITVMMTLSSRVSAAGRVVRERIASYVERGEAGAGDAAGAGGVTPRYVAALCAFELTRMAVQYVISNVTSEFIVLTASQRREIVKMQLYEALSHTHLSFYEQHTYEEVEEIMYYVSDMEGIDVQLHQFLFDSINVIATLRDALQPFSYRSVAVAAAVSLAPYALRRTAAAVGRRYVLLQREGYLPSGAYAVDDELQGGDDDGDVFREGAMLRGDEIIAAIPQLRPYGADVRLVRWWNRHQQRRQHIQTTHQTRGACGGGGGGGGGRHRSAGASLAVRPQSWSDRVRDYVGPWVTDEDISLVRSALFALLQLPHGKLVPGTGRAVLDLTQWLLPMVASAYGRVWCAQPGLDGFQLLEGMQAMESLVDTVVEAFDTAEMIGCNAYKASMLERLLQPTQWEVLSREEEAHVANFTTSATAVREAAEAQQTCVCRTAPKVTDGRGSPAVTAVPRGIVATVAETRSAAFYRRHYLRSIEIRGVRLRHLTPEQQQQRQRAEAAAAAAARRRRSTRGPTSSLTSATSAMGSSIHAADARAHDHDDDDDDEAAGHDGSPVFTGDVMLWSPAQRRGRFVCITGPNGAGKSALVNLLLALYVNTSGHAAAAATTSVSPHAGELGTGTITFRFTPRTKSRKSRRTALLQRQHVGGGGGGSGVRAGRVVRDVAGRGPTDTHGALKRTMTVAGVGGVDVVAASRRTSELPAAQSARVRPSRSCPTLADADVGDDAAHSPLRRGMTVVDADADADADRRVDLRAIPADVLRRHIFSYVPETPTLFPGATVAQNISLAGYVSVATDAVMRRVLQCAELAQCGFVLQLPLGVLTRVADNSGNAWSAFGQYSSGGGGGGGVGGGGVTRLSPDQAKRLMLARAYFHGGEVLLLDEPTKEIEEASTTVKLCDGWRRLLDRGYLGGVVCATVDEVLLQLADEVITLP
ncbi:ABC transporter [Novymonas esmeraldas]|uniref:ABC transporter n=1 Tax=Novymonas esmeraldas TaxID=1808958 RepID=A0AAW0EUN8_9TRYP